MHVQERTKLGFLAAHLAYGDLKGLESRVYRYPFFNSYSICNSYPIGPRMCENVYFP